MFAPRDADRRQAKAMFYGAKLNQTTPVKLQGSNQVRFWPAARPKP